MIALRSAMFGKRGGGWTNPYITDGLVAMWDGEWNAGGGVHDATHEGLTDLSGNGSDLVFASWLGHEVGENYIVFPTTGAVHATVLNTSAINAAYDSKLVYAECVTFNNTGNAGNLFTIGGGDQNHGFALVPRSYSESRTGYLHKVGNGVALSSLPSTTPNGVYQHTLLYSGTTASATMNGQYPTDVFDIEFWQRVNDNIVVGARPNYTSGSRFAGRLYSLRIYSRALTSAEIAANYAVDKARFNLVA